MGYSNVISFYMNETFCVFLSLRVDVSFLLNTDNQRLICIITQLNNFTFKFNYEQSDKSCIKLRQILHRDISWLKDKIYKIYRVDLLRRRMHIPISFSS